MSLAFTFDMKREIKSRQSVRIKFRNFGVLVYWIAVSSGGCACYIKSLPNLHATTSFLTQIYLPEISSHIQATLIIILLYQISLGPYTCTWLTCCTLFPQIHWICAWVQVGTGSWQNDTILPIMCRKFILKETIIPWKSGTQCCHHKPGIFLMNCSTLKKGVVIFFFSTTDTTYMTKI